MPLFMVNFAGTLDELGEKPGEGEEEKSMVDSLETFVIMFAVIGAVAGVAGFTMVTFWSIAGERQVDVISVQTSPSQILPVMQDNSPTCPCFGGKD